MAQTYRLAFKKNTEHEFYSKKDFEVFAVCNSRFNSADVNILSRYQNTVATALNKWFKLPKVLTIVLDVDFVDYLDFEGWGIATMLGEMLEYLVSVVDSMIQGTKSALPKKATHKDYPVVYWSEAPKHMKFADNEVCGKFNAGLQAVVKMYDYMCVIKLKEIWKYDNSKLVVNDKFTNTWLKAYWASIDAAIQFNLTKREKFLTGVKYRASQQEMKNVYSDSKMSHGNRKMADVAMKRYFNRSTGLDKYHWNKSATKAGTQAEDVYVPRKCSKLPPPP